MSDTSNDASATVPAATPSVPVAPRPPRLLKLRIALGMLPQPSGRPPFIWVERWNAFIVGIIFAFGVPILGYSGLSISTKWAVAAVWFALWSNFFMYFEGRELIGQMMGRGAIKQEQLSEQQNTSQDPFYGIIAAFVIWLLVLAVHVAQQPWSGFLGLMTAIRQGYGTTPIYYGVVEWFILLQGWFVTGYINYIMYNTGNTFSKAAPMGERSSSHSA